MKLTTKMFEKALATTTIDCNSHRHGRPRIRRKVAIIAAVESDIKQEIRDSENLYVGFQTVFTLYKSKEKYFLQISGVSTDERKFPRRNKIIDFETPEDFAKIVFDENDLRIRWSYLTEHLLDAILDNEMYLTDIAREAWELAFIDVGE